jgi:hypothetical protein
MKNIFWFILIGLICLAWLYTCNCNHPAKGSTTVKIDTIYHQVKGDTSFVPKPYAVYRDTGRIEYIYGTRIDRLTVHDTVKVIGDYFSTYLYSDTQHISFGKIIINDTVTENKIAGRGLKYDLSIPEVRITKTLPKRNIVFFTLNSGYSNNLISVGGGLLFKNKQDAGFGINAMINTQGQPLYGFQFVLPIRLHKN